jgi:hypothetical protein
MSALVKSIDSLPSNQLMCFHALCLGQNMSTTCLHCCREHRFGSLVIVSLCAFALAAVFALATHGSGTATVSHSPDAVTTSSVADAGLDEQHFMFFLHGADALAFPSAEAAAR